MESDVVTLELGDHLDLADDLMRLGRIRHMPVVSHGCLAGIVSQRDLFRAGISSVLELRRSAEKEWMEKIRVEEVMSPDPITIDADAPLREAIDTMIEKRIGCLPVVAKGRFSGLLSESDCMRHLGRLLALADDEQASLEVPSAS